MTIFSLKCFRCDKINCKKFYKCITCNILCCKDCLDETNPNRLTYRVLKDDEFGIEKTIYCPIHCNKEYNYCYDCGGYFSNLSTCSSCLINFCSECHDRNMGNLDEFMIENDTQYNRDIKQISSLYCSKSCFRSHYLDNNDEYTLCFNCGELFVDYYGHGDCQRCLKLARTDCDVLYDKNRTLYQKEILILLSDNKITEKEVIEKVDKYMEDELFKNEFINKNKVTFHHWLYAINVGACTCMTLYDNCIIKVLKEFKISVPKCKDTIISNLIEHIS